MTTLIGQDRDSWERPVLADPVEHNPSDCEEEDDDVFQYCDAIQRYDAYGNSQCDLTIHNEILPYDEFISNVRDELDDDVSAAPSDAFKQLEKHPGFDLGPAVVALDDAEGHLTLNRTTRREESEDRAWLHRARMARDGWDVPDLSTHESGIIIANYTERRERQERERSLMCAAGIARVRQTVSAEQGKLMRQCFYSRDKIFRNFGLIRDFTILSVVEAKSMEEVVIATDVPKLGGGALKWAKAYYAGGEKMIYDSLLCIERRANGGLCYDEMLTGFIPLPIVMDLEIKKRSSALYDKEEEHFKELYRCDVSEVLKKHFLRTMQHYSATEQDRELKFAEHDGDLNLDAFCGRLAILYKRESVCDFKQPVCRQGLIATTKHIRHFLKYVIGDSNPNMLDTVARSVERGDIERPLTNVHSSMSILTGCRPGKFSLHVMMDYVYCESVNLSMPLLVYEIARWWTRSNTRWLVKSYCHKWRNNDNLDPETVFRIRALMVEDMLEAKSGLKFKAYKDTLFDEAIYSANHLMRGVFSRKSGSVGNTLVPVLDEYPFNYPIMVHDDSAWRRVNLQPPRMNKYPVGVGVLNPYVQENRVMPYDRWRQFTLTCRDMSLVSPFDTICFSCTTEVNSQYPKRYELENCKKEYLQKGGRSICELQTKFTVFTTMSQDLYIDTRSDIVPRSVITDTINQARQAYIRRIQVDPEMLVTKEDGEHEYRNFPTQTEILKV